ncbi:15441_t:CDS:2 [Entrophospora sp. SA101]|nr:15441_t:CDS:2 [Entrophospora sp. SA101]
MLNITRPNHETSQIRLNLIRARTSGYNVILTDVDDLYLDLVQFVEEHQNEAPFILIQLLEEQHAELFDSLLRSAEECQ